VGLEASQPFQIIQFQHRSHGFRSSGIAPSVSASRGDPNTRSLTFASVQSIEARAIAGGSDLGLTPGPGAVSQTFHRPKGARRFWRDFFVFGSTTEGQPHDDADDFGRRWRREKISMPPMLTKAADGVPGDNPRMTPGPSGLVRTILFASFAWRAAIRDAKIARPESGSSP